MTIKRRLRKGRHLTYDVCKSIASKYRTISSLWREDQAVARKCQTMGWDSEFFPDKKTGNKGRKLTYEVCKKICSQYKNSAELRKNDSAVLSKCYKEGWIYEFFPSMMRIERMLDYNTCKKSAKRFKTRMEFREGDNSAYNKSVEMGWIDSFNLYSPGSLIYTTEEITATAKRYTTHRDFRKHHEKMYGAAAKRGLLDNFTWLEKAFAGRTGVPTNCVYVYEFSHTHTAYVGITTTKKFRHRDHLQNGDCVYEYANSIGVPVPKPKYIYTEITTDDAAKLEQVTIEEYQSKGSTMLNKRKGGSIGSLGSGKWTKEKCIALAKQYEYVIDFDREHHSIWEKMRNNGWDKECTWLKRKAVPQGYWLSLGKEEVHQIAKQFNTRNKFEKAYRRLYVIAYKNGWINEWFAPTNHGKKARPIIAYEPDGVTVIGKYKNMADATRAFGGKRGNINNCCNGITKTAYGKIFRYADDDI